MVGQNGHEPLASSWTHALRDLAHVTLAVIPPRLVGLTEAGDPLGGAALSHKTGGGMIKRHNGAVTEVHSFVATAGYAFRMELAQAEHRAAGRA